MKLSIIVAAVLASATMLASQEAAAAKRARWFSVSRPSVSKSLSPARAPDVKPSQPAQVQPPSQVPSQQTTKPQTEHDSAVKSTPIGVGVAGAAVGAAAGVGTALLVQSVLNSDSEPAPQAQQGQLQNLQQVNPSKHEDNSENSCLNLVVIALIGAALMAYSTVISFASSRKI